MTYRQLMMKISTWGGITLGALAIILFVIIPGALGIFAPSVLDTPIFKGEVDINWIIWFFMGGMGFIFFASLSPFLVDFFLNFGVKGRLRKIGQKTTATVVSVEDTGVTMNLAPLVVVTVELPNHIKGSFETYVSRVDFPRAGDRVDVVFNPNKPTEIRPAYQIKK